MSKHTPGPWTACMETFAGRPSGFHIAASPHGSTRPICETGPRAEFEPSELEANARLIAAAPEMYEALRAVMADYNATKSDFWGKPTQIRNSTIEAIAALFAKAEGRK